MAQVKELPGPDRLDFTQDVEGKKWVAGVGPKPAKVMVVGQSPGYQEIELGTPFVGKAGQLLRQVITKSGLNIDNMYITNAVKYATKDNNTPTATDINNCFKVLQAEINDVQPELIVALGNTAIQAVVNKNKDCKIGQLKGMVVDSVKFPGYKVLSLWHPAYVLRSLALEKQYIKEFGLVNKFLGGTLDNLNLDFELITTTSRFEELLVDIAQQEYPTLIVDTEWSGTDPKFDDNGYIRLLQIHYGAGKIAVVKFYPGGEGIKADVLYEGCADVHVCMSRLQSFLDAVPNAGIVGHNIMADARWLLKYGVDIRDRVIYDTMLAEHMLNNVGTDSASYGLTELTLKYTDMGRYDRLLEEWKTAVKLPKTGGYGLVPDEILLEYAGADVEAVWRIMNCHLDSGEMAHFCEKRGLQKQYPSLLQTAIHTAADLIEMRDGGMTIDIERLDYLVTEYHRKKQEVGAQLIDMLVADGKSAEFNYRSHGQVRSLLFDKKKDGGLALTPIKSTGKPSKSWDWVMRQPPSVRAKYNPSTDKTTLDILRDQSPIVQQINNLRKLDTICKNLLRDDDSDKGLRPHIWPDGKIHPDYWQLTDTGRFRTSKPNCQNFPKAAEGDLLEIFGKGNEPSPIRSMIVPDPGYILMEVDYSQAELFVLAGISSDDVMMKALTTPGKDLHDVTAINSFNLQVQMPDGQLSEDQLLQIAKDNPEEFEKLQSQFQYVDPRGRTMDRTEFKNTIRVSAKAINFGIPYGRGPGAIALQVHAETGEKPDIEEIRQAINGWKSTYSRAWSFMCYCQDRVVDPGFIVSPWGRIRVFRKTNDETAIFGMKREASNFPIQSTVADTMALSCWRIVESRKKQGLGFKIVNQIHDAFLLMVPENEVPQTEELVEESMGGIEIPMPSGKPLRLGVDVDLYSRWGEKPKK
jgi:uracil-DNA glycosylase family 4